MAHPVDFASLQAMVARWNGGSSDAFYDEAVRDCIGMAENDLDRLLWVPERVKRSRAEFSSEYEPMPADLARLVLIRRLEGATETRLRKQPLEALPGITRCYAGPPFCYAEAGAQVQFAPPPTASAPMIGRWIYYSFMPRLSDTASCTAALLTYGDIYLYTSLKHLATFTSDEAGVTKWTALSDQAIAAANRLGVIREAQLG